MIAFACPACGKQLKVKDELAGKKAKCPACAKPLAIPSPPPRNREPAPPPAAGNSLACPHCSAAMAPTEDLATLPSCCPSCGQKVSGSPPSPSTPEEIDWAALLAPPQAPDEIGRLGPYRVLAVLGHGGMGVVFRAEDPHLERPVALKAMLPSLASNSSAKQRF